MKLRSGRLISLTDAPPEFRTQWRPARVVDVLLGIRQDKGLLAVAIGYYFEGRALGHMTTLAPAWGREDFQTELAKVESLWPPHVEEVAPWLMPAAADQTEALATGGSADRVFARTRREFNKAAEAAQEGRLTPALANHLLRVQQKSPTTVDVPDLPAFGAWCLDYLRRRGEVRLATCEWCGYPWIPDRGGRFCLRPAPGHRSSCRTLGKQKTYTDRHGDFNRERRRLHERMRRGTLSQAEYREWQQANSPSDWKPHPTKKEGK